MLCVIVMFLINNALRLTSLKEQTAGHRRKIQHI